MGSYIQAARDSIRSTVEEIVAAESADIRVAITAYRDHPPQDSSFVTQSYDFTPSVSKVKKTLESLQASGGGDGPEAVVDGLHAMMKLDWRPEATKVALLIADAPPHGLGTCGDGFPEGCPDGLDIMQVAGQLAEKEITLHVVGCEPAISPHRSFFQGLALVTGGVYAPLSSAKLLGQLVTAGAREEIAMEQLMKELEADIAALKGSEEERAEQLHQVMASRKVTATQMQCAGSALPKASAKAKVWASKSTLAEVRSEYVADAHRGSSASPGGGGRGGYGSARMMAAAGAAPAKASSSSSEKGGLFSRVRSYFGGAASAEPMCEAVRCEADEDELESADVGGDGGYSASKAEVTLAQCERLVSKAARRTKRV